MILTILPLLAAALMLLSIDTASAADRELRDIDGRVIVLHDNGTWSYKETERLVLETWNRAACQTVGTATIPLSKATAVKRIVTWYSWGEGRSRATANLYNGAGGAVLSGTIARGDCDSGQPNWCQGKIDVGQPLEAGTYYLQVIPPNICANAESGRQGFIQVYAEIDEAPPSLPFPFTLNFEEGDLRGWTQTGNAFKLQPTLGDNPTARGRGQASHHEGQYWIGGYEAYQGLPGQNPGAVQGDAPKGVLTSSPFRVDARTLSFLVGGGSNPSTRVELVIDGAPVLAVSGRNTETMSRVEWDLTPYAGRMATIRIVDESSGGWGHINADDFRLEGMAVARPQ